MASPYPSTWTRVPNGMTLGSTAITFIWGLLFRLMPVAVIPLQPAQFAVYAVDLIVIVFDPLFVSLLLLELDAAVFPPRETVRGITLVPTATTRCSLSFLTSSLINSRSTSSPFSSEIGRAHV